MFKRVAFLCSTALLLSLAAPIAAQETAEASAVEAEAASPFSGIFQLDVTTAYYFRGILQERDGLILQPWAELYYNAYSSETGFLRDVTIGGGAWNSFQSERTLAGSRDGGDQNQWWYELDVYPLVSLGFANGLSLTTIYYWYTSPNDGFATVGELNMKLAWDDSEAFGAWSMQPWVNLAIEAENTSFGSQEGTGLQVGIAPTLYTTEDESFSLSLPVEAGFSLEDYYEGSNGQNHEFGYANAGLAASVPLSFVPESAGAWSLGASVKYFLFGHILEDYNNGHESDWVGTLSLGVEF